MIKMKSMDNTTKAKLLKDRRVLDEIRRHLWIESERAGYDIGFDRAAQDWLENFSKAWMQYHLPKRKPPVKKKAAVSLRKKFSKTVKATKSKYLKAKKL